MVYHIDSNLESPAEDGEAVDISLADHTTQTLTTSRGPASEEPSDD